MSVIQKPRCISLFSGAGGCSLGFVRAGFKVLLAIDNDEPSCRTYSANFPETRVRKADVTSVDWNALLLDFKLEPGELEILIGGPPCQGFSTAGKRFWDDPRNNLLKSYVEALKTIQPKWFLMENVEGLLTAKRGEYLLHAMEAFVDLGYQVRLEKVYSHEYGVSQRRKRVVIVGNRLGVNFDFPKPTTPISGAIFRDSKNTFTKAIHSLPPAHSVESTSDLNGTFPQGHYFVPQTGLNQERIERLKPGQTMKDLPEALQHESFKRRANRRVMDGTPSEKRGGAPSGLKRLIGNEPSLTITSASTREFIHPSEDRSLTIRECARLQGFADEFEFFGPAAEQIKQIGNAIPPLLAQTFALHIKNLCGFTFADIIPSGSLLGFSLTKAGAMSPALRRTQVMLEEISLQPTLFTDQTMPSTSTKTLFTKLKILGSGDGKLEITNNQIRALLEFSCRDLAWDIVEDLNLDTIGLPETDYFATPLEWFEDIDAEDDIATECVLEALQCGVSKDEDFRLFIHNLAALHKRRLKYRRILSEQPRPTMDQVGPRSLLEYGVVDARLLSSWMIWRKWIFDIDNRSGQETGYLFEPILASCIGGEPVGSKNSPVKRIGVDGKPTKNGRQIDCYVAADKTAYEFKLRVTIAASGQGRFAEELSFPAECRAAGLVPILLVLDPTPSHRLTDLSAAFEKNGGFVLIGEAAWTHMDREAGQVMATFIDTYIKPPLARMATFDESTLVDISLSWTNEKIIIGEPAGEYVVQRKQTEH